MKRIVVLSLLSLILLAGCSFSDLFVDQVAVHNGLIQKMDAVMMNEGKFYDEYWALQDNGDVTPFIEAYNDFDKSFKDLDDYFANTKFASGQQVFKDDYNDYYKSFLQDYLKKAKEFKDLIEKDGYTFDAMEPYFEGLDKMTERFVEVHNRLINTINLQADYTSEGMTYNK